MPVIPAQPTPASRTQPSWPASRGASAPEPTWAGLAAPVDGVGLSRPAAAPAAPPEQLLHGSPSSSDLAGRSSAPRTPFMSWAASRPLPDRLPGGGRACGQPVGEQPPTPARTVSPLATPRSPQEWRAPSAFSGWHGQSPVVWTFSGLGCGPKPRCWPSVVELKFWACDVERAVSGC